MKRLLFFLFLLPILILETSEQGIFSGNDDPSFFNHVHVISGHLNLSFQDGTASGPKPLYLNRNYTSSGALEEAMRADTLLFKPSAKGWMFRGGWSLLNHTTLTLLSRGFDAHNCNVYATEPGGMQITYDYEWMEENRTIFFKPNASSHQASGLLSGKTNAANNRLKIDLKSGIVTIYLPDGGTRIYKGNRYERREDQVFKGDDYHLMVEHFPDGHDVHYGYDKSNNLISITSKSPTGKVFASIDFQLIEHKRKPPELIAKTSDNEQIHYFFTNYNNRRDYLNSVQNSAYPDEKALFVPGRKGIGCRLAILELGGQKQFEVNYHRPTDKKHEEKWAEKPEKKPFHIDKVLSLKAHMGPNGSEVDIAQFSYQPGLTEVRDAEGLLIRYHHDNIKLNQIDYFDHKDHLRSIQKLYWEGSRLKCKALLDERGNPLFAKTFTYDQPGNVIEENLWGTFTGIETTPLKIDPNGNPSGGENHRKTYSYIPGFNLLKEEWEEGGPTIEYRYKEGTNLIEAKFTKDQNQPLIREFYFYDQDNLLIHELIDNGISTEEQNDLTGVTQRLEKHYNRDPITCLPTSIIESYLDQETQTLKKIKEIRLTYENNKLTEEAIYDAEGQYRFTLYNQYDSAGRLIHSTNPLGQETICKYDPFGRLIEFKEPGSQTKFYKYDAGGRQISVREGSKTFSTQYDAKGRPLAQSDSKNQITHHTYDCFGNKVETRFPSLRDQTGKLYEPITYFEYDIQGNLIAASMPLGETTRTTYNTLRKPLQIIQPDGGVINHFYNKNGTLAKTIYPDGTEDQFTYDILHRPVSKSVISSEGETLAVEHWQYDAFKVITYTDPRGLTTHFAYDGSGRKIGENREGRTLAFAYDSLGFLEKTDDGITTNIELHDVGGRVIEMWQEDHFGAIENRMEYLYNDDNRKIQAFRFTSQGRSVDHFEYDAEGLLIRHTDPIGAETTLIHEEGALEGQKITRQTLIDPLLNTVIETKDGGDRTLSIEKRDPSGKTVAKQEFFYDRSGNKAKQISSCYLDGKWIRESIISWRHDTMGRVIEEDEAEEKTTHIAYDLRGRVKSKMNPSGVKIDYQYDGLGRLVEQISSDGTIHYTYSYEENLDPVAIIDHINGNSIQRSYNHFSEISEETTSEGLNYSWTYDLHGRSLSFSLPDRSKINYDYRGRHLSSVERCSPSGNSLYAHKYLSFDPNGHVEEESLILNLGILRIQHDLLERPFFQASPWHKQTIEYGPSGLTTQTESTLFGQKSYQHDSLNQLIKEGDETHTFDSLGNPANCTTNHLNQILSTDDEQLSYDANGNLIKRLQPNGSIEYQYDALNRLTAIIYPEQKKFSYSYDPFSRIVAKETFINVDNNWVEANKQLYLYNNEQEIGTINETGTITQLKVLGLGIQGDIGGAIAIEIDGTQYAPIHDFSGNIIGIVSADQIIVERYDLNAFGKESQHNHLINPWRFSSKRHEEGLVFFGLRFYDPSLQRWLTPDPLGFADSANLYVYVLNSPLRRLDLFGLLSEDFNSPKPQVHIYLTKVDYDSIPDIWGLMCKGTIDGIRVDFFVFYGNWHKLQFTAEELKDGRLDIANHLHEMILNKGPGFVMADFGNGVDTNNNVLYKDVVSIAKNLGGILCIAIHNKSWTAPIDVIRTYMERLGFETPSVCQKRQYLTWALKNIDKINPEGLLFSIVHSEGALIDKMAHEGLEPEVKILAQKKRYIYALGAAEAIPNSHGKSVVNTYSDQDYITGVGPFGRAARYMNQPDYNVQILKCISPRSERNFWFADHGFLSPTYRKAWEDRIDKMHEKIGFIGLEKNVKTR